MFLRLGSPKPRYLRCVLPLVTKITVFTMFFWTRPSKNIGIYAVFSMLQEVLFHAKGTNTTGATFRDQDLDQVKIISGCSCNSHPWLCDALFLFFFGTWRPGEPPKILHSLVHVEMFICTHIWLMINDYQWIHIYIYINIYSMCIYIYIYRV